MSKNILIAWIGLESVGQLSFDSRVDQFAFEYAPDWIRRQDAFPISPVLPFQRASDQPNEVHSTTVKRHFENLLPEGKALDDAIATFATTKSNIHGLLRQSGHDTAGALTLLPEGQTPAALADVRREITYKELSERIINRTHASFNIWDGKPRMPLAGHQDKLAVYIDDGGRLFFVDGPLASTHILKPQPLSRLPALVANEHFCLRLASQLDLPAAHATIIRVPEPVLVITRFDRRKLVDCVQRLHAIDGCQALGLAGSAKYERNFGNSRDVAHIRDGASLAKCFELASQTPEEGLTRMTLIRWTLFQYLIGNSDAHGKNLSFFVDPAGLRLAPAYDLVAVTIYPDIEHELAMAIGDEFTHADVRAVDWQAFAQYCQLDQRMLAREMARMAVAAQKTAPSLARSDDYQDDERSTVARITDSVLRQSQRLKDDAVSLRRSPSPP